MNAALPTADTPPIGRRARAGHSGPTGTRQTAAELSRTAAELQATEAVYRT